MISGIYTAIMLVIFIGIFLWAWSKRNKKTFEELSKMPLQNDQSNVLKGSKNTVGEHHE